MGIHFLILQLLALLLLYFEQQRAVDPGQDTAERDGGADQSIKLLVAADSKLEVARGDTLDLEILGGVASEFEDFRGQIFEDGGDIDGRCKQAQLVPRRMTVRGNRRGNFQGALNIPLAPTRILFWVLVFRKRLTRPQGNYREDISSVFTARRVFTQKGRMLVRYIARIPRSHRRRDRSALGDRNRNHYTNLQASFCAVRLLSLATALLRTALSTDRFSLSARHDEKCRTMESQKW